jgi:hypothetical protein
MSIRYDEKGKIFTSIITKDAVPVLIQTSLHRIEGNMYVRQEERIKEALDESKRFLALTDVIIFDLQGNRIIESDFLAVNCDQIVWIIPKEDYVDGQDDGSTEE